MEDTRMFKKKILLFISVMTSLLLISCSSSTGLGTPSTYTVVNDFPNATIKIMDVSTTENTLTVEFSYSGENGLTYGEHFEIEILQDNTWYTLSYDDKFMQPDIGYSVESGTPRTETYSLTRYNSLASGQYRIIIPVSEERLVGSTQYILATEFEIQ